MKTLSELALLFAAAASPCTKTGKPGFAVLDDTYGPEPVDVLLLPGRQVLSLVGDIVLNLPGRQVFRCI